MMRIAEAGEKELIYLWSPAVLGECLQRPENALTLWFNVYTASTCSILEGWFDHWES